MNETFTFFAWTPVLAGDRIAWLEWVTVIVSSQGSNFCLIAAPRDDLNVASSVR